MKWEILLEPEVRTGQQNMAIDQALLEEADRSGSAVLRLYRWSPPCLSFGRNEPALARYDRAKIERLGIPVVRRPTGGRAVWHEHEVTYAVAAPIEALGSLRESYCAIHQRLAAALQRLGVPAALAPATRGAASLEAGACFAVAAGGEVTVEGRKVIGSAQVRHGGAFLQHGSILLDGSQDVIAAVSRQPAAVSKAITLREVLGREVTFQELAAAIVATWGDAVPARSRPFPPVAAASDLHWVWRR